MSEPVRYDEVCNEWNGEAAGLAPCKDGAWVKWEDYARLKADVRNCHTAIRVKDEENARLKADIKDLREDRIRMCDVTIEDIAVIARLKAEVERLTEKVRKIAEQVTKERKSAEEWHGRMTDDYNNPNGSAMGQDVVEALASLQAWEKAEELLKDFAAKEGKGQP